MTAGLTRKVIVQQLPGRRFGKNTLGSSLLITDEYVHYTVCSDMATCSISCLFVPIRQPDEKILLRLKSKTKFDKEKNWLLVVQISLLPKSSILNGYLVALNFDSLKLLTIIGRILKISK
jgi:hypothetical protein